MKRTLVCLVILSLILSSGLVRAQGEPALPNAGSPADLFANLPVRGTQAGALAPAEGLPKAGLTPESPFYFLDRIGEVLRDLLTFNPEAKARLQVRYAAERVAEIKIILETKGVNAKGLKVARARLEANAAKAVDIVEKEKEGGKDVSKLAGEIVDNFHIQRKAAKQAFEDAKQEFFTKKRELHNQLLVAIEAGDTALEEQIRAELSQIEAAKDEAEAKKDATIAALEAEKDRLQDELEEKKRQEDEARDAAEDAEEAKEEAEEKQQEMEEKMLEEEAKKQEKLREAGEREQDQLKKEREQVEEERKRAEEQQRETESEETLENASGGEPASRAKEEKVSAASETQARQFEQGHNVRWSHNGDVWLASSPPPQCPEPLVLATPVHMEKVASMLYPGQYRGNHYKAHGGFGFEGYGNKITITAPMRAELYGGARYTQSGETQYIFDFIAPCGIMYRFDHLRILSPKLDAHAQALPLQIEDTRFRRDPTGIIFEEGDEIATEVGMTGNPFIDLGVYDLRKKNESSKDPAWAATHSAEQAHYGVCWFEWLPAKDAERAWSLPPRGNDSTSDYCKRQSSSPPASGGGSSLNPPPPTMILPFEISQISYDGPAPFYAFGSGGGAAADIYFYVKPGTTLRASSGGRVSLKKNPIGRTPEGEPFDPQDWELQIYFPGGYYMEYDHVVSPLVADGAQVQIGQPLARAAPASIRHGGAEGQLPVEEFEWGIGYADPSRGGQAVRVCPADYLTAEEKTKITNIGNPCLAQEVSG